jgi:ATP-dependent protease HslVU (ClpYQ) peptidase subunit
MTCIVGIADQGHVYMGGDSAGVAGLDLTVRTDPKVFVVDEYLLGFTTSFRMMQLIRFNANLPAPPKFHDELFGFMVKKFIEEVRKTLKNGGFAKKENEVEFGGCFLVGVNGRLFTIHDDYQVGEAMDRFAAVGCGAHYALGSLASSSGVAPLERVRSALEVAEHFSAGVSGPFAVMSDLKCVKRTNKEAKKR